MPYVTQSDLVQRFGETELIELTNIDGEYPDTVKISQAIVDAEALMDSYLAAAYSLPLPSTPKLLVRIAANIARKYLHEGDGRIPTEEVENNYKDSIKRLEMIAAGKLELGVNQDGSVSAELDTVETTSDTDRVFKKDVLAGF